jgi:hypothetical protein
MDQVFSASGLLVMPLWLLMVLAPRWSVTEWLMRSPLVVLPAALLYAALIVPSLFDVLPALARPELGPIAALLGTPAGATIAWVHFLAFDLFVGRWVYLDARERGISSWVVSPVLVIVLMVGPLGLATYLGLRALLGQGSRVAT